MHWKGWPAIRLAVVPKIRISLSLLLLGSGRCGYACYYWRPGLGHLWCQTWKSLTNGDTRTGGKSGSSFLQLSSLFKSSTTGGPDLVSSNNTHTLIFQILIVNDWERFLNWALQPVLQPVSLWQSVLFKRFWFNSNGCLIGRCWCLHSEKQITVWAYLNMF